MSASARLPAMLAENPRLDRWVGFPAPGRVAVSTGRVEIGQGVLTAMLQIAAEELDVAPDRILLQTGDTELTPNEGYTAGSQSIQFGGVALRLACAEVRALFLDHAAANFGYSRADLSVARRRDHPSRRGRPATITGRSPPLSISCAPPPAAPPAKTPPTIASSAGTRRASTLPPRCSASRSLSTT